MIHSIVAMIICGIGVLGFALLINPRKTLPVIAKFGLAGWYYDRQRGSALPTWCWRLLGAGYLLMALIYGPVAVMAALKRL